MSRFEYYRQWRIANKEKLNAYAREWRARNKAKVNEWHKSWYASNRQKIRSQNRSRRASNKDEINARLRAWSVANRDKIIKQKRDRRKRTDVIATEKEYRQRPDVRRRQVLATKRWCMSHPEKARDIRRARSKRESKNPYYRILSALRIRICDVLRGRSKSANTSQLLGCSIPDFMLYLESKFDVGMSWSNYGRKAGQWSIDHIVPCSLFDLSKPEHQRHCFHFSNLRSMWHVENLRKGNRGRFQLEFLHGS